MKPMKGLIALAALGGAAVVVALSLEKKANAAPPEPGLEPGDPTDVPGPMPESPSSGTPVVRVDPLETGCEYEIRTGDTLWALATKRTGEGIKWRELLAVNPDVPRHESWGLEVYPGDVIRLPASWC